MALIKKKVNPKNIAYLSEKYIEQSLGDFINERLEQSISIA